MPTKKRRTTTPIASGITELRGAIGISRLPDVNANSIDCDGTPAIGVVNRRFDVTR
jgi:hypothetical protein